MRRSRSIRLAKTHWQHVLTGIAINLIRGGAWLEEILFANTRRSPFAALRAAAENHSPTASDLGIQPAHNGLVFLARQTPCSFLALHGFPSQVSQSLLLPESLSIARVLVWRAGDLGSFPLQTPPNRWTSSADPMASHTRLAHLIGLLREMREQCLRCGRDGVPGT
jgi:hypothetical protein